MWVHYILLAVGVDGMAVGFAVAAVVLSTLLLLRGQRELSLLAHPVVVLLGAGIGVLPSVVPHVRDRVVLHRVGQARFAVLLALLPTTATVIGSVVLDQQPGGLEALGIAGWCSRSRCGRAMTTARGLDPVGSERPPLTLSNRRSGNVINSVTQEVDPLACRAQRAGLRSAQ